MEIALIDKELQELRAYRAHVEDLMRKLNDYVLVGGKVAGPITQDPADGWRLFTHDGLLATVDGQAPTLLGALMSVDQKVWGQVQKGIERQYGHE